MNSGIVMMFQMWLLFCVFVVDIMVCAVSVTCQDGSSATLMIPTTGNGTVISTNTNSSNYWNNMDCRWLVTAPAGYFPVITFTKFNVEQCGIYRCYDFFTVYNGNSTAFGILLRYGGAQGTGALPSPVSYKGSTQSMYLMCGLSCR